MGIFDRITGQARAQFLDVLEWVDDTRDTILWRHPIHDRAITDQSKLVVREGQAAVFLDGGAYSASFAPGTYTLDTPNAPIRTFFASIQYALETPYKGDVLFVNTRQFTENRWGTQAPFMMRDAEFGPVRVRAFGTFSFRVVDPVHFVREIVGSDGEFTTDEIVGQLKKRLVASFASEVAAAGIGVLDLAAHYVSLGDTLRDALSPAFAKEYGVEITDLTLANIGLPEAVEQALDTRSRMGILGDLGQYSRLQAAEAIGTAAANPGMGGAMAGAGVGLGVGQVMGQAFGQGMTGPASPPAPPAGPPPLPTGDVWHYSGPDGKAELSADAIVQRITANRHGTHHVWRAGMDGWLPWDQVPALASKVPPAQQPPPIPTSQWHYSGPDGQAQLDSDGVVAKVQAAPDADHHVWAPGYDGWKPARQVPELAARLAGPPPPPGNTPPPPPSST